MYDYPSSGCFQISDLTPKQSPSGFTTKDQFEVRMQLSCTQEIGLTLDVLERNRQAYRDHSGKIIV